MIDAMMLATSVLTSDAGKSLLTSMLKVLSSGIEKKVSDAKQEYLDTVSFKDLSSPVEIQRHRILDSITELQTKVMLYVSNQALLVKLLAILLNLTVNAYEAPTEKDLTIIDRGLGQVRGAVEQYQNLARRRVIARRYAVIVSILALVVLAGIIFWGSFAGGPSVNTVLPVIEIPLPILIWSAIGSFTAILYRFNSSGEMELQDPLRWLLTRPLTGIVMGIIAYFVISVGFLSTGAKITSGTGAPEVLWLIAFISGFSDRFANGLLRSLVGRFGGKEEAELVTLDTISASADLSSTFENLPVLNDLLVEKPKQAAKVNAIQNTDDTDQKMKEEVLAKLDYTTEKKAKTKAKTSKSNATPSVDHKAIQESN